MGIYGERVLPRLIDVALGKQFDGTRARVWPARSSRSVSDLDATWRTTRQR